MRSKRKLIFAIALFIFGISSGIWLPDMAAMIFSLVTGGISGLLLSDCVFKK